MPNAPARRVRAVTMLLPLVLAGCATLPPAASTGPDAAALAATDGVPVETHSASDPAPTAPQTAAGSAAGAPAADLTPAAAAQSQTTPLQPVIVGASAAAPSEAGAASLPEPAAPPGAEQSRDLFERMRAGFQLEDPSVRAIDLQVNWYASNPEYLERVFGRAELYLHFIVQEIEARGMPLELALLPVVESAFEPFAYSRSRAAGLWQFIPGTGRRFGLPQTWWYDGRRDVLESTRGALDYLQFMHDEFDGDWLLAVAGYNCGEGCVARLVRAQRAHGKPVNFWSIAARLPAETRAYVPKLLAMKRLVANPQDYGIAFSGIPDEPYFVKVEPGSQIDLRLAAELSGITHEALSELNPAFHRWATPPEGPHHLLLPDYAADAFREAVAQLTPDELLRVNRHTVARGETIAGLARKYNTQPLVIRQLNALGEGPLVVGAELKVPSGDLALPVKVALAAARFDRRVPGGVRAGRRPVIHVVRRGDTLWALARRNNINVDTLRRLNGLAPGETLRPGQKLVVSAMGAPSKPSASSSRGRARTVQHVVRRGDTLSGIARIYRVTIAQLASWNGISVSSTLRLGQKIVVRLK